MSVKFKLFFDSIKSLCCIIGMLCLLIKPALSSDLPVGYTKLEYIESTGTQYILTGIKLNEQWTNTLTNIVDGYFTSASPNLQNVGGYDSGGQLGSNGGKWSTETVTSTIPSTSRTVIKQILNNTKASDTLYLQDVAICTRPRGTSYWTADYPIFTAYSTAQPYTYNRAKFRLYNFKMYTDNVLARNFIPAKRNSDSEVGLYDTETKIFYTNSSGTGTFVAGPIVEEYTKLEYIKSTGSQYIDTGVAANSLSLPNIKTKFASLTAEDRDYFGTSSNTLPTIIWNIVMVASGSTTTYIRWGSTAALSLTYQKGHSASDFNFYNTAKELNIVSKTGNAAEYYVNDALVATATSSAITNSENILISKARNYSSAMWYSFSIKDNGTLIRDFVPVKRDNDGAVGMYDNVEKKFYASETASAFIAGPESSIKVATTKYVETKFAPITTELNTTIGTIKDVVDNTIIQADRIGKLATGKQTRPDEQCPKGRECLLIIEADGSLHWYPICGADGRVDPLP